MDLERLLSLWAYKKAREREEKEKREAEERQRQLATQEQPDSTGSYSWWKTADAEAKENIKNFLDFITK